MAFTYFISYVTRLNYSTILIEIIDAFGFSKAAISVPLAGMALAYGVGQLLSGYVGDKLQPKHIVGTGLIITAFMNTVITFCTTPVEMTVIWSINGMAQAFMWPPIVKLMSELFDSEGYNKACIAVTSGGHLGHILIYFVAPILINLGGWKLVFYTSAALAIVMLSVWMIKCPLISIERKEADSSKIGKKSFPWSGMLVAILFAIILQGSLRDGISAWMPSLISETFHLGNNISILTGVLLPIFAILSIQVVSKIKQRFVKNELKLAAMLFGVGTISSVLLVVFKDANAIFTVILLGVLVSSMNGTNLLLISFVPRYYSKFGVVSLVSGILNSSTYIGSAISTYAIAVVSEGFGWTVTIFVWGVIAILGGLICSLQIKKWERFSK